ncbi:hypothetical protein FJTKL_01453 [Diaporthe vaccinii]|uniref:Uncharacterized protein n=1 Tax=Diaporthe vaccinii TaxID=105482 RepID=A0ABR4E0G2_9PEZI
MPRVTTIYLVEIYAGLHIHDEHGDVFVPRGPNAPMLSRACLCHPAKSKQNAVSYGTHTRRSLGAPPRRLLAIVIPPQAAAPRAGHGAVLVADASEAGLLVDRAGLLAEVFPVHGVAEAADAGPEGLVAAAGAPRPAGALRDGQVVPAEGEEGTDEADEEAEEDVEAVVPEVVPPRAGDEDGREEGRGGEDEQVQRRGRRLLPHRRQPLVVSGEEVRCRLVVRGRVEVLLLEGGLQAPGRRVAGREGGEGGRRVGLACGRGGEEGEGDGELAGDEQAQVGQPRRGGARVARRVGPEPVLQQVLRVGPVGHAAADAGGDEPLVAVGDFQAAHDVLRVVIDVRVAARQQVRARLAEEVLHAVGDEPGRSQGEGEPQPADVELPQLALPDQGLGRALWYRFSGHKDKRDDQDDDYGDDAHAGDEQPWWDGLVFSEGKSGQD